MSGKLFGRHGGTSRSIGRYLNCEFADNQVVAGWRGRHTIPLYNANAIVLHRFDLGETDRIVTLFSREHGRISAVAKGSRRPTSRLSGATEPFTVARLLMATGKSLDVISQCEVRETFPALRSDFETLMCATYLCDLTACTLSEERAAQPVLYDELLSALYLVQLHPERADLILRTYEMKSLAVLGYEPSLDRCALCGLKLSSQGTDYYSPSVGGVLCKKDWPQSSDRIRLNGEVKHAIALMLRAELSDLLSYPIRPAIVSQVKRVLTPTLYGRLDRLPRSREFLDSLQKNWEKSIPANRPQADPESVPPED
ncbi:MAG: DNA repair protein RecO [Armatimonadetes bacterium]|nr:DNA repair protein RecO [Armatimonadota bacterium]